MVRNAYGANWLPKIGTVGKTLEFSKMGHKDKKMHKHRSRSRDRDPDVKRIDTSHRHNSHKESERRYFRPVIWYKYFRTKQYSDVNPYSFRRNAFKKDTG